MGKILVINGIILGIGLNHWVYEGIRLKHFFIHTKFEYNYTSLCNFLQLYGFKVIGSSLKSYFKLEILSLNRTHINLKSLLSNL